MAASMLKKPDTKYNLYLRTTQVSRQVIHEGHSSKIKTVHQDMKVQQDFVGCKSSRQDLLQDIHKGHSSHTSGHHQIITRLPCPVPKGKRGKARDVARGRQMLLS
jgi:hypothetical protein